MAAATIRWRPWRVAGQRRPRPLNHWVQRCTDATHPPMAHENESVPSACGVSGIRGTWQSAGASHAQPVTHAPAAHTTVESRPTTHKSPRNDPNTAVTRVPNPYIISPTLLILVGVTRAGAAAGPGARAPRPHAGARPRGEEFWLYLQDGVAGKVPCRARAQRAPR